MKSTNLVAAALLSLCVLGAPLESAHAASYRGLVVFGDSLSDSGNHAAKNGADPSQVISGNDYYPFQAYASGNFSNGPVWGERLAQQLGLSGFKASALGGDNFSYAFAKVLSNGAVAPNSLPDQVKQYLNRAGGVADSESLYILEGGANDLFFNRSTAWNSSAAALLSTRYATGVGAMVDKLQAAGARHILVLNVPNLGIAPGVGGEGSQISSNASLLAQTMNAALTQRLAAEGPEVRVFDFYGQWTQWHAAGPGASGFSNVSDACGAPSLTCDPNTALFWDAIHPTTAAHSAMAEAIFAQVSQVPEPSSLLLWCAGLLLLCKRQSRRISAFMRRAEAAQNFGVGLTRA
ncbi:SGNH/GDSL hydrolase family protein [Kinneretia aquatilis]|jgi:outer membrane lipase/esterase|uniref:SGNH/GDSL hydrolase family protein n=1 Tax=Kinneretia aquatilis TaxID=2070761 RepID=UPI0014952C14|nr:SGNH/GDSL hydrolase family protein [Paucibacter aquatile]WIV97165.1 SGNH/GDSL hydrolase family protein [Paucibacter aquatile]